jgi:F0F1-type ATP synthase assembly protein I
MKGAAYQGAMEAVLAIVISTLLGYWADQHYDTAPRWLIVGVIIGFASFVLRLLRMGRLVTEAQTTAEEETNSGNRSKTEAGKQSERSES